MNYLLIKNGLVINADGKQFADVLICDDKIKCILPSIQDFPIGTKIIDAQNNFVIPGGIDPHVHFHLETATGFTSDNFYTGSKAALAGGTTTIIDFITPNNNESFEQAFEKRLEDAKNCLCDYSFHISPIKWSDDMPKQMDFAVNQAGITSFKVYLAYKKTIGIDDETLRNVMKQATLLKAMVTIHAEDGDVIEKMQQDFIQNGQMEPYYHALSRPSNTESEAVKKAIEIAKNIGATIYFVHISAAKSLQLIEKAEADKISVFAETCPQYLLFTKDKLKGNFIDAAPFVFSPALKNKKDNLSLWNGLGKGTIVSVGTDHCPFDFKKQKMLGLYDFTKIPNGTGGVEYRLTVLFSKGVLAGQITLEQWVACTSTNAAKLFHRNNKGKIAAGFDADIVIWNPNIEHIISAKDQWQQCDSNIYEGLKVTGKPEKVIKKGVVVFENNTFNEVFGNYIKRKV